MKQDLLNFSADLRRIAYWAHNGKFDLVNQICDIAQNKYGNISQKVGCYEDIWEEVKMIKEKDGHAAERALTASVILKNLALN